MNALHLSASRLLLAALSVLGCATFATSATAQSTGTVTGTITDATTQQPLAGVQVSLVGGKVYETDALGVFRFDHAWNPRTYLMVAMPGYEPTYRAFGVTVGNTTTRNVALTPYAWPRLSVTRFPAPNASMQLEVEGDPNTAVVGFYSRRSAVVPLDLRSFGWDWFCLTPAHAVPLELGTVPSSGTLRLSFSAPSTAGITGHLQCVVIRGGAIRLTNPAGFETR